LSTGEERARKEEVNVKEETEKPRVKPLGEGKTRKGGKKGQANRCTWLGLKGRKTC